MAIFYTDTGSLNILQVTGSTVLSGSSTPLRVIGSGSNVIVVSGSNGGLLEVSEATGAGDIFAISSGSIDVLSINSSQRIVISGSLIVTQGITGSLSGSSGGSGAGFPFSGSAVITGSLLVTGSFVDFTRVTAISGSTFSGSFFVGDGSGLTGIGGGNIFTVTSTGISIADPTSAEDITLGYTSGSVTVVQVEGVVRGSATPSVTVTLRYSTDRNAAGTAIVSAQNVTSTTTGNALTLTANTTVPAGNFIWLETTALSGTVNELFIGVLYQQ